MAAAASRTSRSFSDTGSSFSGGNNVTFINSRSFHFSEEHGRPNSRHAIFVFLVPVLLNFVQLKYQGKDVSAFETHRKTMWVAIVSLLLSCLAFDAELRISPAHPTSAYARVAGRGVVLFGSLSSVSLASVLFPDSVRPVLFLLYVFVSAGVLLNYGLLRNWLEQRMRVSTHERYTGRALNGPSWLVPRMAESDLHRRDLLPV